MPSQWLEGDGDTCFVESGQLFKVNKDHIVKAKSPKVNNPGRNISICATFFDEFVLSLGSDHSLNVFSMENCKLVKSKCLGIICPFCGDASRDTGNYKKHKRLHDALPVNCDRCLESFSKIDYRSHIANCPYKCPYQGCDKTCVKKVKFDAHIRMHVRSL